MSKGTVLVSGVTGFTGTSVALAFLEAGYRVRGTARSKAKADAWIARFPQHKAKFEHAVVEDIATPNAFDEAVKGVDYVAHTASPFHMNFKDNKKDMLEPAIDGTNSMINAIAKASGVKHLVVTSSFAAMLDLDKGLAVGTIYNERAWNPATYEKAVKSDNPTYVYCTSKKAAEQAVWDAVNSKKLPCPATTILPGLILGEPLHEVKSWSSLNTSSADIWALINDQNLDAPPPTPFPIYVDVADVALCHVRAIERPAARNQRYFTVGGHFSFDQAAAVIRRKFPELRERTSPGSGKPPPPHFGTDTSKVERDLGVRWRPFEETIESTVKGLLRIEKEIGGL